MSTDKQKAIEETVTGYIDYGEAIFPIELNTVFLDGHFTVAELKVILDGLEHPE